MKFNFEKLEVYQDAIEFANQIYEITKAFPRSEMFGITNQLRRSSVSVPSNIAEGSSRGKKEFIHFLNIALGSSYEPQKRARSPKLTAGLASESKNDQLPYGRRFPAA